MNLKTLDARNTVISTLEAPAKTEQGLKEYLPAFFLGIFKFFASLQLAIFVLSALILILAAGTFIESLHGTEASRILIYDSSWFTFVLLLLGVNVAAAALDRLPWKRKHSGFVITHLGILVILAGSLVTKAKMIDGQMAIGENETEFRITLPQPILYIYSEAAGRDWIFSLQKKAFPWQGEAVIAGGQAPFSLKQTAYFPKAGVTEKIERAEAGPAALKVALRGSFVNHDQWLVEKDPRLGEVRLGPAILRFTDQEIEEIKSDPAAAQGHLEFKFEKKTLRLNIPSDLKLPRDFSLEDTPYKIKILRLLKSAAVAEGKLVDQSAASGGESNPAIELELEGPDLLEKHTVFAKFPDFPTLHGMKPSAAGARIFYRLPEHGAGEKNNELRFVKKGNEFLYQIQKGPRIQSGKVELSKEIDLGWMDLKFSVDTFYPSSRARKIFEPQANTSENPKHISAVQMLLEKDGQKKSVWLEEGVRQSVDWSGASYQLIYGQKKAPAGFKLKLRDFRVDYYPGTSRPASFESDVTLKDDSRGVIRDATISMNKPLVYRGFHIYQSGYSLEEGRPEVSIFAVGKDPGVPLKYLGALIMVLGILLMFYTKRFSSSPEIGGRSIP